MRIGEAPITKNGILRKIKYAKSKVKGETPIEKNIIIVDEQGKAYGATYPKRAKGLVKNGRARYVDDTTICLARPPMKKSEENMENKLTQREIFDRLNELQRNMTGPMNSMVQLQGAVTQSMENFTENYPDEAGALAGVIENITRCFSEREENFKSLLAIYSKMLDENAEKESLVGSVKDAYAALLASIDISRVADEQIVNITNNISEKMEHTLSKILDR